MDRDTVPALLQGGYSSSSGGGSSGYGSSSGGGSTTGGSGLTAGGGNGGTTAGGATSNPLYPASTQAGSAGEDLMQATRLNVQASLSCRSMRPESACVLHAASADNSTGQCLSAIRQCRGAVIGLHGLAPAPEPWGSSATSFKDHEVAAERCLRNARRNRDWRGRRRSIERGRWDRNRRRRRGSCARADHGAHLCHWH